MSKEYIERGALLATYRKWLPQLVSEEDAGDRRGVETCIKVLEQAPAADVVEVKHGRWKSVGLAGLRCSKCGHEDHWKMYYSYCPNCGADMRDGGCDNGGGV